jgi:hypothetical protein
MSGNWSTLVRVIEGWLFKGEESQILLDPHVREHPGFLSSGATRPRVPAGPQRLQFHEFEHGKNITCRLRTSTDLILIRS